MSFDAVVVGAGPAGVFAAESLAGARVCVLDVGTPPPQKGGELQRNQYDLKQSGEDLFAPLIGERFESLHNVHRNYLSPKLKGPRMRYVTERWRELGNVDVDGFDPMMSFATGGLANAWGAGAYRFTDDELRDFPIDAGDLAVHYDALTSHIGITGTDDDLAPFVGSSRDCQPVHRMNRLGQLLARRYDRHRAHFHRHGIHIGAPRMAVLSRAHRGRPAYDYQGLEFFQGHIPSIYNPAFTLAELVREGRVEHRTGRLVERFETDEHGVRVFARDVATGEVQIVRARRLVLAAGALNTARIVLRSRGDGETRLPLLDNPISYVPFVSLRLIGRGLERESLPLQLTVVCRDELEPVPIFASFYGVSATLWNDLLFDLPLSARDNIRMLKHLLPAMSVVQLFYPDHARPENHVRLLDDGRTRLVYRGRQLGRLERRMIRAFRRAGFFGWPSLCKYPDAGNSFHYAGCLPMRGSSPGPFETDADGRLGGEGPVFVADAATFPSLPSKNLTLTIMANARRIGARVRDGLVG
jgi:choline dehydrogenase-like flavoprotein